MAWSTTKLDIIAAVLAITMLILVMFLSGCSFLTPGLDTRMAAEAKSKTRWTNEENLTTGEPSGIYLDEATTHNRKVFTLESSEATGRAEFWESGALKTVEGAEAALWQQSEPQDVMMAYTQLAIENAKVAQAMFQSIENLTGMIAPFLAARGGGTATTQPSARDRILDEILRRLPPVP